VAAIRSLVGTGSARHKQASNEIWKAIPSRIVKGRLTPNIPHIPRLLSHTGGDSLDYSFSGMHRNCLVFVSAEPFKKRMNQSAQTVPEVPLRFGKVLQAKYPRGVAKEARVICHHFWKVPKQC